MSGGPLRIATRDSPLAMWQAETVAAAFTNAHPGRSVTFVTMATFADKRLDVPISELGGKGAFSKEVQQLVLAGEADLAVHSAKDLQALTPDGLTIAAVPERGDPRDVLIGSTLERLIERGSEARIATGSNRRRVQLAARVEGASFDGLRGNIATRLTKAADYDAIVMANAALARLGLAPDVVDVLSVDTMVPQVGQGTLAIECRADDTSLIDSLAPLDHADTHRCLDAERAFLVELGGDCEIPAGAFATLDVESDTVTLSAILSSEDERTVAHLVRSGADGNALGADVARQLRADVGA